MHRAASLSAPALIALVVLSGPARAADPGLFTCRVIVTGTDERSRPQGLERCLRDVVVKVTGQPGLAEDPRTAAIARDAPELIEDFAYLDRMTDIPHHDEQGTRDRPYDLIAHVDPERLQARLAASGLRAWLVRPRLAANVTVVAPDGSRFALTADGDAGERQRQALLAASERFGLRVALPTQAGARPSGDVVLDGSLAWSESDFGWNAEWRLIRDGQAGAAWRVTGVSFDEAFRAGVGGAAERLSAP